MGVAYMINSLLIVKIHIYITSIGRDVAWTLRNRRPEKLRDALKEMEVTSGHYSLVTLAD